MSEFQYLYVIIHAYKLKNCSQNDGMTSYRIIMLNVHVHFFKKVIATNLKQIMRI
jgi:hypothetical protein